MQIVMLGATGFVGQHLVAELTTRGHDCIVLCRNLERCAHLKLIPRVRLIPVQSISVESLSQWMNDADAVINLIGILNERGRNGVGFRKAHVATVENLIEACRVTSVRRVIHMSALNAGKGKSHYLISKGKADELLLQTEFVDVTLIRPSVIFGAGDAFFNRFSDLLKWTPVMPLACPGSAMQPVWVGDVVKVIAESLDRPETIGQSLELGGPRVYLLKELLSWTAKVSGQKRWILGLPDPIARLQGFFMDFVPGKPFSTDNYKSLQTDSVTHNNALPAFDIRPSSIDAIVRGYLGRSSHQQRLDGWRRR